MWFCLKCLQKDSEWDKSSGTSEFPIVSEKFFLLGNTITNLVEMLPYINYSLLRCEETGISSSARIQELVVCINISFGL